MAHANASAEMMFFEESDEDNIETAMRRKRISPGAGNIADNVHRMTVSPKARKRPMSSMPSTEPAAKKPPAARMRDSLVSTDPIPSTQGEDSSKNNGHKKSSDASERPTSKRTEAQMRHRQIISGSVRHDSSEEGGESRHPTYEEGAEEKMARLLRIRNERVIKQGGAQVKRVPGQQREISPEAPTDEWTVDEALLSRNQNNITATLTAEERDNRQRDREAEKRRKAESRARALQKANRGKAIPVRKSFIAERSASKRKKAPPKEFPVDFGSDEATEDSTEDESEDENKEWEVEDIRAHKIKDGVIKYEVKWTGYNSDENTWEPEENLEDNAGLILNQYKENHMKEKARVAPLAPIAARMAKPLRTPPRPEAAKATSTNDDEPPKAASTPSAPSSSIASGLRDSISKLGARLWSAA